MKKEISRIRDASEGIFDRIELDALSKRGVDLRYGDHFRALRQRSEQYLTSSHTFSHFFRHAKGRPHAAQNFCGKSAFSMRFGMANESHPFCYCSIPSQRRRVTPFLLIICAFPINFPASGLGEPGRRRGLGEYHRGLSLFWGGKVDQSRFWPCNRADTLCSLGRTLIAPVPRTLGPGDKASTKTPGSDTAGSGSFRFFVLWRFRCFFVPVSQPVVDSGCFPEIGGQSGF